MEFINKIEINKHEVIKERGKYFAESLDGEDKKRVLSIVEKSEEYLRTIGEQDNVVYSPTKREMATFTVSFKRYVRTDFIDPVEERVHQIDPDDLIMKYLCRDCSGKKIPMYSCTPKLCDDCEEKYDYLDEIWRVQHRRWRMIEEDFNKALDETVIPDELIGNWLLLMRKMREDKESKHIDNALKDFIRDELIEEFRNQNKPLIKKYNL